MPRNFSGGNFSGGNRNFSGGNFSGGNRNFSNVPRNFSGNVNHNFNNTPRNFTGDGMRNFNGSRNFSQGAARDFARNQGGNFGRGQNFVNRNFGDQARLANVARNGNLNSIRNNVNINNRNLVGFRGTNNNSFFFGNNSPFGKGGNWNKGNWNNNGNWHNGNWAHNGNWNNNHWHGGWGHNHGWGWGGWGANRFFFWPWFLWGGWGGWGYPYYGYGYGGYGGYGYGGYGYGYQPVCTYTSYYSSYPDDYGYGAYAYDNSAYGDSAYDSTAVVDQGVAAQTATSAGQDAVAQTTDYAAQGEQDFRQGNYQSAIRSWQHAIVDDPTNGAITLLMAQALFATGEYDMAAGAVQRGLQMVPPEKWNGVVANYEQLYGNIGDYTTQLRALEKARDGKPDNPAMRFLLGYHYGFLGYPKQAVRELNKAVELAPKDEVAAKLVARFNKELPAGATAVSAPPQAALAPPVHTDATPATPPVATPPAEAVDAARPPATPPAAAETSPPPATSSSPAADTASGTRVGEPTPAPPEPPAAAEVEGKSL